MPENSGSIRKPRVGSGLLEIKCRFAPTQVKNIAWEVEMTRAATLGGLFGCFGQKINGSGLAGGYIIYQGHVFAQKGHLGLRPYGQISWIEHPRWFCSGDRKEAGPGDLQPSPGPGQLVRKRPW